ncbi:uncharacterized protein [Montipora capricornis]|uniref:uncharacterized protein isoform X2 n=1 Tax=Montipora capricornis TaxID=246305 RepID=UPI0035F142D9
MNWVRSRCFIVIFLVNHCFVFGKGLLLPKCVKILSINVPLDDPTKAERNYGLHADKKKAVLSHHPGIFKIHKGLSVEKGTVSLESLYHPGYFLRHKNYKFHLEKKVDKPIFNKDATFFILKVTNNPALYAFELCSHPSWFMGHKNYKPYRLVLGKVNESSKEVIDSTFYLASHHCLKKKEKDTTAEKKTILVGSGTFIDEPDEDSTIVINQASKKLSETSKDPEADGEKSDKEASNSNHTESVSQPGKNLNPEKAGSKDTNEDVINEVEEAFRISQNSTNSTYLENLEKDIQDKVNAMAATAVGGMMNQSTADKSYKDKDEAERNIEVYKETGKSEQSHEEILKEVVGNSSKVSQENRKESVEALDHNIVGNSEGSLDENEQTMIDKDIVITGEPELNENDNIDADSHNKRPQRTAHDESSAHSKNITMLINEGIKPAKRKFNGSVDDVTVKEGTHAQKHTAYHDFEMAHKVLNKNIENLKSVLAEIEDSHANISNETNNKKPNRNEDILDLRPLFNDRKVSTGLRLSGTNLRPLFNDRKVSTGLRLSGTLSVGPFSPDLKVSKSEMSKQTTVTKLTDLPKLQFVRPNTTGIQSTIEETNPIQNTGKKEFKLAHNSGFTLKTQPVLNADSIGFHFVAGSGNKTVDIKSQASADDVDRIANELVRHGVPNDSNDSSTNPWMNTLRHHNKTLRETLKELKPYDNNILYLRTCEDRFPKACEEWAAKRYCLTFGELMKRYCRRACKLCNNVLATEFTPCDKSCGGGIKLRMIKVNNRQVLQRRSCNMHNCPVNGGYTAFSNWSECSVTCGEGVRYRHRSCTNPKPQFGGHDCSRFGRPVDTMPCVKSCKELSKSKNHPAIHFDPDDYPEYVAEEKNPKIFERGDGHYFQWTPKHRRKKPVVLHHVNKNVYRHKDHNGKNHYLQVDEEKNPYDEYQTHVVRYQGQQVAKLQCGPSKLLHYRKHVPNIPDPEDFKRSNPYKMFEDSAGEVVYDKDGVPTGTTKDIVQSYDSPYKIILQRGKNNRMKVSEQCIESDASVDPDSYWKNGAQNYEGATSLGSEQPMSDPSSRMPTVGIIPKQITDDVGTTSLGSVQPSLPETSRMTTDLTTPNRFNDNGLYEYKYQDIGEGVDDKTFDADVSDQLSRAMKKETAGITQRFLIANQDPRPTLQEELLAEKEEAWRGGKI